ncbi:MAG: preprotein translocase subunit SecG [bacterium]
MYGLILGLHLFVCICLVAVVLVQSGKGGGLVGGAFGSATQTVFGGRGGTDFVTRATVVLGVLFFVTPLSLALMTSKGGFGGTRSVVTEAAKKAASAPAAPGAGAQATPGAPAGGTAPAAPATPAPVGSTPR